MEGEVMEDKINILEQEINNIYVRCGATITNAIENLIKGYRELEKSHKALSENPEWLKHYWIGRKEVDDYWKSKVKEKIEELEKQRDNVKIFKNIDEYDRCVGKIEALLELMEG